MNESFHIKKITLPSGKVAEIVCYTGPDCCVKSELHVCPECASTLVYPVSWREEGDDGWWIELRCPNCEYAREGTFDDAATVDFDEQLNRGTDRLIDDLETLERANMESYIESFVKALDADAILAEDFHA